MEGRDGLGWKLLHFGYRTYVFSACPTGHHVEYIEVTSRMVPQHEMEEPIKALNNERNAYSASSNSHVQLCRHALPLFATFAISLELALTGSCS